MTIKLSVVLGTYNRLKLLQQAIESILVETKIPVKIYITDAGSTDGTIEYLNSITSENIKPIFVGQKIGQAQAYNQVFQIVDTPYVCWLSDDNKIVNHGLDTAVSILDDNPQIGMVALKTQDKEGPFTNSPYIGGVSTIGILNVNQGVLRTDILKSLGGFCETFRDYGIDPDLTAKVLFSGYDIVYTKQIAIHHYRQWSSDPNSAEYQLIMEKQKQYQQLYQEKYGIYSKQGWGWKLKKSIWSVLKKSLHGLKKINSEKPIFFNMITRDWYNIMTSKYISIVDPLLTKNKPYYLVQFAPKKSGKRNII